MLLVCLGKEVQSVLKYVTDWVMEDYTAFDEHHFFSGL